VIREATETGQSGQWDLNPLHGTGKPLTRHVG